MWAEIFIQFQQMTDENYSRVPQSAITIDTFTEY